MSRRSSGREAYDYSTRICGRLPHRLQSEREARGLSKYALGRDSGVSREMIACIEGGRSIPTLFVAARLAHGMGMTLEELIGMLEDG